MRQNRIYERLGWRYRHFLALVSLVVLSFLLIVGIGFFWSSSVERRISLVLAGDPTTVVLFDRDEQKMVLLSFPAGANISGVSGVGQYSLEALWNLGKIDPRDRQLLPQSLEETAAVPIPWYLGPAAVLPAFSGSLDQVRQVFSFSEVIPFLSGKYRTNLSLPLFLALVSGTAGLKPQDTSLLKVSLTTALTENKLADGTKIEVVDPDRLEVLVGTNFEDERVRREGVHLAVYNTTKAPELGRRAERLLSHVGALVILVGNDSPEIDECLVSGQKQFLETATARFVVRHYRCGVKEENGSNRADLILRLGRQYERRFLPLRSAH